MLEDLELREFFHLLFLRELAGRLGGRPYAVKGGVCLRFFHHSPRLSEDIDLDIARIPLPTLARSVEKIIQSAAFLSQLSRKGMAMTGWSAPKQTTTTQRWKVRLQTAGGRLISTRVEFSRRRGTLPATASAPSQGILISHGIPTFICRYYDREEMITQKLLALAHPARTAARDVFDIHHLLLSSPPPSALPTGATLRQAREKIESTSFATFKAEVLPFLPLDLEEHYGQKRNYEKMIGDILEYLEAGNQP